MVIGFRRRSWLSHRTRAVGMIFGRLLSHLNSVRTILLSVGVPTTRARECQLSVQTGRRSAAFSPQHRSPPCKPPSAARFSTTVGQTGFTHTNRSPITAFALDRTRRLPRIWGKGLQPSPCSKRRGRKVRESAAIRLCLTRGCASLGWDIHHISQAALSQEADLEPLRVIWLD